MPNTQPDSRRWTRDTTGTYDELTRDDKTPPKKIANYGVRITTVEFLLGKKVESIRYRLKFETPEGQRYQTIRHVDLADEQSFTRVALPGFTVTSAHKAFALLRECLMDDLRSASRVAILTHLGWHLWKGKPVFAHAAGTISSDSDLYQEDNIDSVGTAQLADLVDIDAACSDVPILAGHARPLDDVRVEVEHDRLSGYRLVPPKNRGEVERAVFAVLQLLSCGDPNVTYIAVSALFATAIKNPRFALVLYGETGSLKTAYALILMSFYCPGAKESHCASFKSTENSLRARFSRSSNVPIIVDDYVQLPGSRNGGDEAKKAENLIRSVVNGSGKDRCAGDGSLRPTDRPCGLPLITGELLPDGIDSLRQRLVALPIDKDTFKDAVEGIRPNVFDHFQDLAADGTFATAMAAFIAWAAGGLWNLREFVDNPEQVLIAHPTIHPRLIDAMDFVLSGAAMFLDFAQDVGVCSEEDYLRHSALAIDAGDALLNRAFIDSLDDSPTQAFGQHLQAALASLTCHIEVKNIEDYQKSEHAVPLELLGYTIHKVCMPVQSHEEEDDVSDAKPTHEYKTVYKPHGKRIGWLAFDCIDLIPEAALGEANKFATKSGMQSLPSKKLLGKLLASQEWISRHNQDRNTFKVRRDKVVHEVWRIHALRLFEFALQWGDFDVAAYKSMSGIERQTACLSRRDKALSELRHRMERFKADGLLNSVLSPEETTQMLAPSPPRSNMCDAGTDCRRWLPSPIRLQPLPGYDEHEGDELDS